IMYSFTIPLPPRSTLFPYTTLFRSYAHFGVRLIMAFLADKLPQLVSTGIDAKVLGFTAAVAILTGIISGILPALHLSRANVNQRSEEHTSELQSRGHLVCRLLLEKK